MLAHGGARWASVGRKQPLADCPAAPADIFEFVSERTTLRHHHQQPQSLPQTAPIRHHTRLAVTQYPVATVQYCRCLLSCVPSQPTPGLHMAQLRTENPYTYPEIPWSPKIVLLDMLSLDAVGLQLAGWTLCPVVKRANVGCFVFRKRQGHPLGAR